MKDSEISAKILDTSRDEGVLSHNCVLSAQWFELRDLVIGSVLQ